jgi:hypothetical protein
VRNTCLPATLLFLSLAACTPQRVEAPAYGYQAANLDNDGRSEKLRLFPPSGEVVTINLPFLIANAVFGPAGKSIYGINAEELNGTIRRTPAILKIEFKPTRTSTMPGTAGFAIKNFAVSAQEDRLVISGRQPDAGGDRCGIFVIALPAGTAQQVLRADCRDNWHWDQISLSPTGEQAIATVGSGFYHNLHLELINLTSGAMAPVGNGYSSGV